MLEKSDRNDELNLEGAVAVPAFYLKAFDDKGAWENFEKLSWLTVDIISTYSGVGNLTKLRYLIKAGKVTSLIILRTAYGIIEVTAGVMSIGLSLIENNENQEWVNKIRSYLFWAEIYTLGAALATTKILSRQAAEARQALNQYLRTVREKKKLREIDQFGRHLDDAMFHSISDPVADILGPGTRSHPQRPGNIIDLKSKKVEIKYKDAESLAYAPGTTPGTPGQVHIHEGASISAWEHEYRHFLDDEAHGLLGMRAIADVDYRIRTE